MGELNEGLFGGAVAMAIHVTPHSCHGHVIDIMRSLVPAWIKQHFCLIPLTISSIKIRNDMLQFTMEC